MKLPTFLRMSTSPTMRSCSICAEEKPLSAYQSDGRGGKRLDCAACSNARRRMLHKRAKDAKEIKKAPTPRIEKKNAPVRIKIEPETEESIIDSISKKHGAHMVLSVQKCGKAILQIHSNPNLIFKGLSVSEVLSSAL